MSVSGFIGLIINCALLVAGLVAIKKIPFFTTKLNSKKNKGKKCAKIGWIVYFCSKCALPFIVLLINYMGDALLPIIRILDITRLVGLGFLIYGAFLLYQGFKLGTKDEQIDETKEMPQIKEPTFTANEVMPQKAQYAYTNFRNEYKQGVTTITIPAEQRKRTTLASNLYYDTLEIHDNKVVGFLNGNQNMTWYFKEYSGIDFVKANMNSQFAQVVFLTGMNAKNRAVGIDFGSTQNLNAMNDTNRILFCSGMLSFDKTNDFAKSVADEIRNAFENYKNNDVVEVSGAPAVSAADELKKFKELLDSGVITQEEFDEKKKQLLGL